MLLAEGFHEIIWCRHDDPEGVECARRRLRTLLLAAAMQVLAENDAVIDELGAVAGTAADSDQGAAERLQPRSPGQSDPPAPAANRRKHEFELKAKRIDELLVDQREAVAQSWAANQDATE